MKPIIPLCIFLLSAFFTAAGHAAGGPMNQDLTSISVAAQKAVDAGKRGDAETFVKEAEDALAQAKAQADSAAQQRIVRKLKAGVAAGKAGNLSEGIPAVEDAMTDMTKAKPPRFGGGS